jgi:hypothetical protein
MDPNIQMIQQGQVWVAVVAALSSLIGTLVALYTQARNRRWQIEDAERLEKKTAAGLQEVKETNEAHHQVLKQAIDDNTLLTAWAADKAAIAVEAGNNWDRKWMVIEKMFSEREAGVIATHAEEVHKAVLETKETVEKTHEIIERELDHGGSHERS